MLLTEGCTFGPGCAYPCHCDDPGEACTTETGSCPVSGCEDGDPGEGDPHHNIGSFNGTGCQIGRSYLRLIGQQFFNAAFCVTLTGWVVVDQIMTYCQHFAGFNLDFE